MSPKDLTIDNEWYTPKYIVDMFGQFDYDPATNDEKAKEFNIPNYDTKETNGLLTDWTKFKRIWINPPFTNKKAFLKKAVETFNKVHNEIFVVLPIQYLTTKSFNEIVQGAIIYLPNGRINFEKLDLDHSKSPAFGSVIIQLNDKLELRKFKI